MRFPPLGESTEPAFQRRKNKKYFPGFHPVRLFCAPRLTRNIHEIKTHTKRDLSTIRRSTKNAYERKTTSQHSILQYYSMGFISPCFNRGAWDRPLCEMSKAVYKRASRSRHAAYGPSAAPQRYFRTNEPHANETEINT